jgi:hemerythrin-like domain-containing protein
MKATEILMQEHRAIERALHVLEIAATKLEEGETVPAGLIGDTMQFIRLFADRCHHGKEEGFLFPALERSGLPKESGPLAVMQTDHDEGRALVRSMGDALREIEGGNAEAVPQFCRDARDFSALLRAHIMKEDHVLFVMADMRLPDAEKDKLTDDFMAAEASGEACRPKAELLRSLERLEREIMNENAAVRF